MPENVFGRNQLFQRVIDTTITCRSIVKYNSNLSAEQKAEVLREIEGTLGLLEQHLEGDSSVAASIVQKMDGPLADVINEGDEELFPEQENWRVSLYHLYRLYRSYLSNKPGRGMMALEARYRAVMRTLDRVQEFAGGARELAAPPGEVDLERMLGRVRGFVTALYCMFREFALVLSNIIDGKPIDIDTEVLDLLPRPSLAPLQHLRDITPLIEVFGKHLRLLEHRGALADCAREAGAFLVFLEESLGSSFARRKEIVAQIKVLAGLLNELIDLLADYEQAVGTIIQSPSASL